MTTLLSTNGVASTHGHEPTPASPFSNGKDAHGRFAPGNRGGPGNPFARQCAALRQAFFDAITEEDMHAIAGELAVQARMGDKAAIKLLLSYVLGKPTAPVDPDTLDVQEWQLWQQKTNIRAQEAASIGNGIPAEMACTIARATVPAVQKAEAAQLQTGLLAGLDLPDGTSTPEKADDADQAPTPALPSIAVPPTDRQQTGQTASCHRQQTAETAEEFPFSEAEVAQATAWLIAACNDHRHQTVETANGKDGTAPRGPDPAG
jgi:hypothetical protein